MLSANATLTNTIVNIRGNTPLLPLLAPASYPDDVQPLVYRVTSNI